MSETIAYLEAVVGADITAFRREMRNVRAEVGILSDTISGLSGVGRSMTYAVTAPIVAIGAGFVKIASDFDAAMRNINSIAQLSENELKALSDQTLAFGATIRGGPQAAAEALYEVYSAGKMGKEAFDIMTESVRTAQAGLSDLSSTTNAITASVSAFSTQQLTAAEASNVWTRMVAVGVGSLDEFLSNSQKVLPAAAAMGVSFENVGQAAAYISQQGGGARKAMTSIGMLMSNLLVPNTALQATYEKLGVTTGIDLVKKFGSLEKALFAIKNASVDADAFMRSFSKTGREAALILTNDIDKTTASFELFKQGLDTATADAFGQQMLSFSAQWDLMTAAISGAGVAIGQILMPVITPLINLVRDGAIAFMQLDAPTRTLIVSFFGLAAAIGPILWLMGSLFSWPSLLISAFVTLAGAVSTNWNGIRDTIATAIETVLGDLGGFKGAIDTFLNTLFADSGDPASGLEGLFYNRTSKVGLGLQIEIKEGDTLWSIWDNQFKGQFTWEEFRSIVDPQLAAANKTPLNLPVGFVLNFGDAGSESVAAASMSLSDHLRSSFSNIDLEQDTSLGARFAAAFEAAWPQMQIALGNMWTNFKSWITNTALPALDEFAGAGLTKLAQIFLPLGSTGKGNSPLYDTIRNMLSGGIKSAMDDVGDTVVAAVPKTTSAFQALFTNIGTWIMNEAVPSISRALGYVVGTIGTIIGQGLGAIWNSLISGEAAEGASNVGAVLGDKIGTPFAEGMNDALSDAGITNPADQIATALAGGLGTVAVATILLGGFSTAFSLMWAMVSTTTSWIVSGARVILTQLGTAFAGSGAVATLSTGLGTTIAAGFSLITAGATWIVSMAASILGALGTALISGTLLADLVALPLAGAIGTAIAAIPIAIGALVLVAAAGLVIALDEGLKEALEQGVGEAVKYVALGNSFSEQLKETDAYSRIVNKARAQRGITPDMLFDPSEQMGNPLSESMDTSGFYTTGRTAGDTFVSGAGTAITEAATSPELTAATEALTQDMSTQIVVSFGEGSPTRLAWDSFVEAVKTGATEVSAQIAVLGGIVFTTVPLMSLVISAMGNIWVAQMKNMFNHTVMLTTVVNGLVAAVMDLNTAVSFLAGLRIEYVGSGDTAGGEPKPHASGGSFKGMGMVGERGPEPVFFGQMGTVMPFRTLRDAVRMGSQDTSSGGNTIVIQGVQDVDALLFELKRRGYSI